MPPADAILAGLTNVANQWRALAIGWHVVSGALMLALLAGWRPSNRVAAGSLTLPLLSVSGMAWASGNPFNGTTFATLALLLAATATRLSTARVGVAPPPLVAAGVLLVAFGWTYPHFLETDRWTTYLYAAPFGLVPCPTLSLLIGVALIFNLFGSALWSALLALSGMAYGVVGVFRLGVTLDAALLAGAVILGARCLSLTFETSTRGR